MQDQQRRNRMAAALTVNAILFLAVLVVALVYQMVFMVGRANKLNELKEEEQLYQQKLKDSENDLDYLKSEDFLFDVALELGFHNP